MTPDDYYTALADAGEGITMTEGTLRRLAARSPADVDREEALSAADALSATRRRLRALVASKRAGEIEPEGDPLGTLTVGPLVVDRAAMKVTLRGRPIHLGKIEFRLLAALADDPMRVYPKDALLRDVWGYQSPGKTRTVDAHACRLRKKLGRGWVANVHGVGYALHAGAGLGGAR